MKIQKRIGFASILVVLLITSLCVGSPVEKKETYPDTNVDAIAVWQYYVEDPVRGNNWDVYYSLWDDDNRKWWTPQGVPVWKISEQVGDDFDPNVEFGPAKKAIAVWSNQNTGDIYYSMWSTDTLSWTKEQVVSEIQGLDMDPDIAYNWDGFAIAVWVHIDSEKNRIIYYSTFDGTSWSKGKSLTDNYTLSKAQLPEVTFVSEFYGKDAIVIWTDYEEYTPKIFYSKYDGISWSTPSPIPNQNYPPITDFYNYTFTRSGISEFGRVKAVWAIDDGTNWSIYYSLWDGTNWSIPLLVGNHRMPEIDCNGYDYSMIVYNNHRIRADIYSSYEGDNFLPKVVGDTGDNDWRPAVSFLQNGIAIAVFWSESSNQDIYYSRWDENWSTIQLVYPESNLKGSNWNPEISSDTLIPSMRTKWWKWFPDYPRGRPPESPPPPPPVPPDEPKPPPGPPPGTPGPVPPDSPPRRPVPTPQPTPTPTPEGSPVPGISPGATSVVCHWEEQSQTCTGGCNTGFECTRTPNGTSPCACLSKDRYNEQCHWEAITGSCIGKCAPGYECTRTPKGTSECACLETGNRDIVARSVEFQEDCKSGEICTMIFRVANHGDVKIENFQYLVRISGKDYGPFQYSGILESGQTIYISMNSIFTSTGQYNGKFLLDPNNLIDEIDEKNNNIDFFVNVSKKSETPVTPPSTVPPEVTANYNIASKLLKDSELLLLKSKSVIPGITPCELIRNEALNYYNQAISYMEKGDYANANNMLIQSISGFDNSIYCFEGILN
ncbi:MAG: hypothetical protein APG12_01119 [Candidatus Methanofastidiosum methylothiophilum]|uniref:CARDB domain-containing protein n=1 Tax=Candidatus Methanofastidiosum methylothiophilum TaxID=1705564 RepID=A0A150IIG3_9EURY|nr:MAG: hypothetical protein APG10_01454 [Candidatus Methanofastidiosum methylthiophilus]KYC47472.1 MAG: hypothetical protein APG11_01163 [Candidatus Methanofastidiosum methylthiophilus]KYC50031.1 MAG: hypothetical protein APG12_01119 [Candidatus Methanofastidiosum methylthiophilus]